jgi:hypothetical protein
MSCSGETICCSNVSGVLTVVGPGSRFFDDCPYTSWPLAAVKTGSRLISRCSPPISSQGTQTL